MMNGSNDVIKNHCQTEKSTYKREVHSTYVADQKRCLTTLVEGVEYHNKRFDRPCQPVNPLNRYNHYIIEGRT